MDVDELVAGCVEAVAEQDRHLALREVLERAVADDQLINSLIRPEGGLNNLYASSELTVLNVIWPPNISLYPHDHRMWAAIGIYRGREDNAFYRRQGATIVESGGKTLSEGDVQFLGDDAIHGVHNPARDYTGAIHVYGGDFFEVPRSQWDAVTLEEAPYDVVAVRREFEQAERDFHADRE